MQTRGGQALGDGPRRVPGRGRELGRFVGEVSICGGAEFAADIGQAPLGDLGDDAGAGNAADSGRHMGVPSNLAVSVATLAARNRTSRSRAAPELIVRAARVTPAPRAVTRPAARKAAAAFSKITSRRGPASPAKTASMSAAFSAAVPPARAEIGAAASPSSVATMPARVPPLGGCR